MLNFLYTMHFSTTKHVLILFFSSRVVEHDLLYIIQLLRIMRPLPQLHRNPTNLLNSYVVDVHNFLSTLKCLTLTLCSGKKAPKYNFKMSEHKLIPSNTTKSTSGEWEVSLKSCARVCVSM